MFWVISVYFNVRNILPKSGTFPPGHSVYVTCVLYMCMRAHICVCVCARVFVASVLACIVVEDIGGWGKGATACGTGLSLCLLPWEMPN